MTDADHIARIDAITSNARTTWFTLLAVLIFVAVTLMGVRHIDFYGPDRATQLPFVNVSVPTRLFFYTAPLLLGAIYCYFHLYLIRLIDVLSRAPARTNGARLGEAVTPWLVTDAFLLVRRGLRGDNCAQPRSGEKLSALFNLVLAWIFGLVVLWFCWYRSLPARDFYMSLSPVAAFAIALLFATFSIAILLTYMQPGGRRIRRRRSIIALNIAALGWFVLILCAGGVLTYGKVVEPFGPLHLTHIDLNEAEITARPDDWLPHAVAMAEFRANWCRREELKCKSLSEAEEDRFRREWGIRRDAQISALSREDMNHWRMPALTEHILAEELRREDGTHEGKASRWDLVHDRLTGNGTWFTSGVGFQRPAPDLRGADLQSAFAPGANLILARLDGVQLTSASLERANLMLADFGRGADLRAADLNYANLSRGQMEDANLSDAQMEGANLTEAHLAGAILYAARLKGANLRGAWLEDADLMFAQLDGADLTGVQAEKATFRWAKMDGANLGGAQLSFADLMGAKLTAANFNGALMKDANLTGADLYGADLGGAQLDRANLSRAQLTKAKLSAARMAGARLVWAQMEGANLSRALLEGADLYQAQMVSVDLSQAEMGGANLERAQMMNADLTRSRLEGVNLFGAEMSNATLLTAILWKANLQNAQLQGANFGDADMREADLSHAQMQEVILNGSELEGAVFDFSFLSGSRDMVIYFNDTELRASQNHGGAFRFATLREANFDARTDFRNAFMDGSVELPKGFAEQMGGLCQRIPKVLDDETFFARWRGWVEIGNLRVWEAVAPPEWRNVTPIPPPEGCKWKTGPLPGAE